MKVTTLPTPEVGLIAITRGMAGAGAALLLVGNMDEKRRRMIGIPLLALGILSTIPFIIHAAKNTRDTDNSVIGGGS
jgi:hypothetical protein